MTNLSLVELRAVQLVCGVGGGEISGIDPDGEIGWTLGLPPGAQSGEEYLKYFEEGMECHLGVGVVALLVGAGRAERNRYGAGGTDSGANPDYRPARLSDDEARLRLITRRLTEKVGMLEKRAFSALERMPTVEAEVIEQDPVAAQPEVVPVDPQVQPEVVSAGIAGAAGAV